MTAIVRDRDRALGPHPGRPAGGGDLHPRALRGRRPGQGLRRRRAGRPRSTPASPGSTRSPSAPARSRPGCCSRSSSTGAGTRPRPSTRRPRTPARRPGRATVISTLILLGIYVVVAVAAQAYAGVDGLVAEPGRRAQLARHRSLRLAARQDPDHRRAHLGGGLDPDDDPADRADDALDGARATRCRRASARSTPASSPRTSRRMLMGGALDRLVRRPDPGQRRHPLRLAGGARA